MSHMCNMFLAQRADETLSYEFGFKNGDSFEAGRQLCKNGAIWMSGQGELQKKLCTPSSTRELQLTITPTATAGASGSATPSNEHTFIATEGPGKYIPYVCAIDSRGARTCSESSFTLNSNSNISESEVQSLLDGIDFVGLQDTGDDDAIFDGVSRLAAQLKGVQDSNDDDSSIGSNEVVAALEILNATLNDGVRHLGRV
eukprot:1157750-Pelagomonas_calceolata.AAC.9